MRTVLRRTYASAVIVIFVVILLAGFTQTNTFRSYLKGYLAELVTENTGGSLALGTIRGNLITSVRLGDLSLTDRGQSVLRADELALSYDPFALIAGQISIRSARLVNPDISLWRGTDSLWALQDLFMPPDADTAASTLRLRAGAISIINGTFRFADSLALAEQAADTPAGLPRETLEYAFLDVRSINLSGSVNLAPGDAVVSISELSFELAEPAFSLRELRGAFTLAKRRASIRGLTLVTAGSRLSLDASLEGASLGEIESVDDIRDARMAIDLISDRLSSRELQLFLPGSVDFLSRQFGVDLKARGTLRSLEIEQALVRTPRTFLRVQGFMSNLDRPEDLTLDLRSQNAILDFRDVPEYLPGLGIPDLSALGSVTCDLSFTGRPVEFTAGVMARSQGSQVEASARMDFTGDVPEYDCTLTTENLDPSLLTGDPALAGSLRSITTLRGAGFDLHTLRAVLRTELDSSRFWGMDIGQSVIVADAADGVVRSHATLQPGVASIRLSGSLFLQRPKETRFQLQGSARGLDLGDLLRDPQWKSDLTFQMTADGSVADEELVQTTGTLQFLRSSFGDDDFDGTTMTVEYDGRDSLQRSLSFLSDAAELYVDGRFTPLSLVHALEGGIASVVRAVQYRAHQIDSTLSPPRMPGARNARTTPLPLDARVILAIGDAYPLGVVLGSPMEGALLLEGSISGTEENVSVRVAVNSPEFTFSAEPEISLDVATLELEAQDLRAAEMFPSWSAQLDLSADAIGVGTTRIFTSRGSLHVRPDSLLTSLAGLIDSLVLGEIAGTAAFRPAGLHLVFPTVRASFGEYLVTNQEPVDILWNRSGVLLQSAAFQREAELITVSGLMDAGGFSDINIELDNFLLSNLRWFVRDPVLAETFSRYAGILAASVDIEGPLSQPRILFGLNAEGVRARQAVLGQLRGFGSYIDGVASVDLSFRSRPMFTFLPPELLIRGTVPLVQQENRAEADTTGQAINLDLIASNFSLEVLDPFIPVLANLSGAVTCNMKIRGTLDRPSYEGSLRVQEARFLFTPLNLEYLVDGQLTPEGERIGLQNVVIRNVPTDQSDGRMAVEGSLTLQGLRLKEFDLTARGQLLVMRESAALSREILYGDLVAGTGPAGIVWRGSPSASSVSGEVLIRSANLFLPPGRETFADRDRQITVVFINDTTVAPPPPAAEPSRSLSRRIAEQMSRSRSGGSRENPERPSSNNREPGFLENIAFNLTIETRGVTQLWIIINQLTNELLFADLKGRLVFVKDRVQTRLTGDVQVSQQSYYNYIRQFQASGQLRFTGDPTNPELGVKAVYEGFHRPSAVGLSADSAEAGPDKKVTVTLNIEGTRQEPKVTMQLALAGPAGEPLPLPSQDVEADAISFLVSGKFRDELTSQERSSLLTTSLAGIGSTILSGPLTEFVRREVGFIKSVDVLYYGGSIQEATDIRLTGELGDAVYRLGGKVFSDIGNTNVNVQYPMSSILQSEAWRNFILEYERRVEEFGTTDQRREPTNAIKLLYRITF